MKNPKTPAERFAAARVTFNYCGVCGRVPRTRAEEPNRAPLRWWDPDDGWKVGSLCHWCAEDVLPARPSLGDYAYAQTNGIADDVNTDEDPALALED